MQEFGCPHVGMGIGLNNPQFMSPNCFSKQEDVSLPPLIKKSIESSHIVEMGFVDTDDFMNMECDQDEINEKLKDSLTATQFEMFEEWCTVVKEHLCLTHEVIYYAGARFGIKLAKQSESID